MSTVASQQPYASSSGHVSFPQSALSVPHLHHSEGKSEWVPQTPSLAYSHELSPTAGVVGAGAVGLDVGLYVFSSPPPPPTANSRGPSMWYARTRAWLQADDPW